MARDHSPLPWCVEEDVRSEQIQYGAEPEEVCSGWNVESPTGEVIGCEGILADGEANARFIVRACNAYDEMLAALKSVAAVVHDGGVLPENGKTHKAVLAAIEVAEQSQ